MTTASVTRPYGARVATRHRVMKQKRQESTNTLAVSGGALLLTLCGFAGTGAPVSTALAQDLRVADKYITCIVQTAKKKSEADVLDGPGAWVNDLNWLRDACGASVSHLADLFGVTRKAFYGWLDGGVTPRRDRISKISALRFSIEKIPAELRAAVLDFVDRPTSGGTIRGVLTLAGTTERETIQQLDGVIKELAPVLAKTAERLARKWPRSRHLDNDFSTT